MSTAEPAGRQKCSGSYVLTVHTHMSGLMCDLRSMPIDEEGITNDLILKVLTGCVRVQSCVRGRKYGYQRLKQLG